jgi:hypothetical protein
MMVGFLLVFLGWISPHIDMNRPMIRRHLFEKFGHGKRKNEKTEENEESRLVCVSPHSSAFRAEEPPGAPPAWPNWACGGFWRCAGGAFPR